MKKGFTLLELIVVVIILGILISIAIPTFRVSMEKSRSAEGIRILGDVRRAQLRYYTQWDNYGPVLTNLDITVPTPRFFGDPALQTCTTFGTATCVVAVIVRNATSSDLGQYLLGITRDGGVYCGGGAANACTSLGITGF